jgi:uncharacterized phage infection (PIP) family protein YhgE
LSSAEKLGNLFPSRPCCRSKERKKFLDSCWSAKDDIKPMDDEPETNSNSNTVKTNNVLEKLISEFSLFWHSIVGDGQQQDFDDEKLQNLSMDQIRQMTKALSEDRKRLHQKLEEVQRLLDEKNEKLETLRLVRGETENTLSEISRLHDLGQAVSEQLEKVNEKIKSIRLREENSAR